MKTFHVAIDQTTSKPRIHAVLTSEQVEGFTYATAGASEVDAYRAVTSGPYRVEVVEAEDEGAAGEAALAALAAEARERRADLLSAVASDPRVIQDGSDSLGVIVDEALRNDADVTSEQVVEIVVAAQAEAQS